MRRVLATYGSLIHEAPSAYFYRYFLPGLPANRAGVAVLHQALHEEMEAIASSALWPLGRRWVVQA